jgi:LPS-assembly protein
MTVGSALRLGLATGVLAAAVAGAAELPGGPTSPAEVRVMSLPGQPTVLTIQTTTKATVDDRTPGAHPPVDNQGAASVGETFADEITIVLRGAAASREAAIDVADALVSTVRLFPDPAGTKISVFVRQPVTYAITRPSATGAVTLTLRPRTVAAATPAKPGERRPARPKPEQGEDEVAVDAAELTYEQEGNVLVARGGVTLTRGATTLRADEVRYDRTRSIAQAHGNVVLVDPEATVEGDAATLNLSDETGAIEGVQADMKQSPYRLTAGHVEKRGGPCYGIKDGVFTTCRCGGVERPSWTIAAEETDITVNGVGIARGATFRVNDVPVLYSPYLPFPANTDRESGLLMPRVGYSNRRGFLYEQPMFWAIDKSSDLTVTPVLETAARVGIIGNYRYAWSLQSGGTFTGAYFNEHIGGNPHPLTNIQREPEESPTDRWVVAGRHRTRFGDTGQLYLDVLRVSDDNLLREVRSFASNVSTDIQIRSTRYTRSRLGVLETWAGGAVQADATAYQDLIDPQRFSLDRLPRIAAEHSIPLLNGLAVARLPGEAVNFQRDVGYDGLRLDLAPELFVPFKLSRYLFGGVRGQVRETAYHLTDDQQMALVVPTGNIVSAFRRTDALGDLSTDHTREIGQVEGRIATELARVFSFPYFGLDRIRHSIEPEVQYLFVPQVGRDVFERRLPSCLLNPNVPSAGFFRGAVPGRNCDATLFAESYLFDEVDAINRRNFVSYGVTTRILGRVGGTTEVAETAEPATAPVTSAVSGPEAEDVDVEDEDEDLEAIETIDPDTIPQGLPASAIPPFNAPRKGAQKGAVTTASRELMRASLLQGYDISRELAGRSHLSDVDAQLRITPVDWLGVSYNTTFDIEERKTLAQSVGLVLREPWWAPTPGRPSFQAPSSIGVAYRFVAGGINEDLPKGSAEEQFFRNTAVEGIDGTLYLRAGDYVGFGFLARYALSPTLGTENNKTVTFGPRFLERDYFVRFTSPCACWAVEFGVSDRADTGEVTTRVQLALYGLGSFGQAPGRGFAGLAGLQGLGFRRPTALGREY